MMRGPPPHVAPCGRPASEQVCKPQVGPAQKRHTAWGTVLSPLAAVPGAGISIEHVTDWPAPGASTQRAQARCTSSGPSGSGARGWGLAAMCCSCSTAVASSWAAMSCRRPSNWEWAPAICSISCSISSWACTCCVCQPGLLWRVEPRTWQAPAIWVTSCSICSYICRNMGGWCSSALHKREDGVRSSDVVKQLLRPSCACM